MRINVDTVIEETHQASLFRRRRLEINDKWMMNGVIEPAFYEAAVSFDLWFDQAQLHDRYVVHYDSIASTAADPMTASSMVFKPARKYRSQ